jgi:hypothetical protein
LSFVFLSALQMAAEVDTTSTSTVLVVTVLLITTLIATLSKSVYMSKVFTAYFTFLVKTPYILRMYGGSKYYVDDANYPIVPIKGFKKGLKKLDNMHLPILIKNISHVKTMTLRDTDCFVNGYPRSGKSHLIYEN